MYRYFSRREFDCKETGENRMDPAFILELDKLRERCGFPFVVTSGYRSPQHSVEREKAVPGTHAQGIAADIKVGNGHQRFALVRHAIALGFMGVGVGKDFVHIDKRRAAPVMWVY